MVAVVVLSLVVMRCQPLRRALYLSRPYLRKSMVSCLCFKNFLGVGLEIYSKQFLGVIAAVVITTGGAVFAGTKYLNEQQVQVLKERLELEQTKPKHTPKNMASETIPTIQVIVPQSVQDDALADPKTRALVEKVELLEKEKSELLKQLSKTAVVSLDPNSEVSILLDQLSKGIRVEDTVSTLFKIQSPISFEPMLQYFVEHLDDSYLVAGELDTSWLEFFLSVDEEAGLNFSISLFENGSISPDRLYSFLKRNLRTYKSCQIATPELERIAQTNSNSEIRGNAKLLLGCRNIDKPQQEQQLEYNSDELETYHIVYDLFVEQEIESDFHLMALESNRVYFWSTSSFLYNNAIKHQGKNRYFIALEKLSDNEMSKSSKAFSLLLLSKLYSSIGDKQASINTLDKCHEIAPITCGKLDRSK
ncbi:hypothetical protein F6B67_17780 [Vibrio cholerae]|nr:hypothetical protein [Vibrio cholerae]EGQ9647674.1 hypothetical protein [Vibrio cholerae]